ncbi:MAG: hypothetical protein IPJ16_12395 [Bacteroidales bacterium]|nr:hypothetical protein [Bacteroidales bacterium]
MEEGEVKGWVLGAWCWMLGAGKRNQEPGTRNQEPGTRTRNDKQIIKQILTFEKQKYYILWIS